MGAFTAKDAVLKARGGGIVFRQQTTDCLLFASNLQAILGQKAKFVLTIE